MPVLGLAGAGLDAARTDGAAPAYEGSRLPVSTPGKPVKACVSTAVPLLYSGVAQKPNRPHAAIARPRFTTAFSVGARLRALAGSWAIQERLRKVAEGPSSAPSMPVALLGC